MSTSMIRAAAVLLCASLLIATPASGASESIRIGFLAGMTGPVENLADRLIRSAQLAVDHVNAGGGIRDGVKLSLMAGDTACTDGDAAEDAAQRMADTAEVMAIVGALCGTATKSAANNVAIPSGLLMLSPATASPGLSSMQDRDLVFRTVPSASYQGEVLARLIWNRGVESIAIVHGANEYGESLTAALETAYVDLGGRIVTTIAHEDGNDDYRPELDALEAASSDALVILAYADGSGEVTLRQALERGRFSTFFASDEMVSDHLLRTVDATGLGRLYATYPSPREPVGFAAFESLAKAAGINAEERLAAETYDAAFLLALAIQANGSKGRTDLNTALRRVATAPGDVILPGEWTKAVAALAAGRDIDYLGASGRLEFDAVGDVPGRYREMQIRDGAFVDVGPAP